MHSTITNIYGNKNPLEGNKSINFYALIEVSSSSEGGEGKDIS